MISGSYSAICVNACQTSSRSQRRSSSAEGMAGVSRARRRQQAPGCEYPTSAACRWEDGTPRQLLPQRRHVAVGLHGPLGRQLPHELGRSPVEHHHLALRPRVGERTDDADHFERGRRGQIAQSSGRDGRCAGRRQAGRRGDEALAQSRLESRAQCAKIARGAPGRCGWRGSAGRSPQEHPTGPARRRPQSEPARSERAERPRTTPSPRVAWGREPGPLEAGAAVAPGAGA